MSSIVTSVISPISSDISPPPAPPASSSSNSSSTSPSPTSSQPNQTTDPPASSPPSNSSSPPPQSPPPDVPTAPPPSPPPALSTPPPASSPPPPPLASPPTSLPTSPPPADNSPPSPVLSPPAAQSGGSPPPQAEPAPPVATSPPPQIILRSPPPPANVPTPPSLKSPPSPPPQIIFSSPPPPANVPTPPSSKSPPSPPPTESSSTPPTLTPPPSGSKSSTPPTTSPASPTLSSPPPSVPSTSSPPTVSPPATPSTPTTNVSPSSSLLPTIPTEKTTATSTNGVSANATSSGKNGLSTGGAVAIGIFVGFIVLSLLGMAVWFVQKRRKRAGPKIGYIAPSPFALSQNSDAAFLRPWSPPQLVGSGSNSGFYASPEHGGVNNSRSWFTYEELIQATSGFSEHNLLGEGGFGCVYKGILTDGREVAVKQLKIGGGQGEREFRAEVEIISRVHHRHLVSLVGYCISEHQRLLVYDYVPNNTLHYHLHGRGRPVMDWAVRVKVAAGAARGIAYLHEDCHPRIIHRDIKSSNILLDNNFEAQVSDFGLAKLALDSNTHVTTRVMGTFGYMAPEYATSGKLTEKSDVYSFGVVLLELITGRRPVDDTQPLGDESLVEWARPLLAESIEHENFEELVDPRLGNSYVKHEMYRMIEAAAACVRHSAAKRPRMSQVVRALDSLDESSDITNGVRPGQSGVFDSAQQSAEIRLFQRLAFGSQDYSSSFFNHTQSSWRSREYGSQDSWRSREHENRSGRSQEHRDRSTVNP
ncbi:hypothetical protein GQ457_02G006300 [Hibiscus cannabinus]